VIVLRSAVPTVFALLGVAACLPPPAGDGPPAAPLGEGGTWASLAPVGEGPRQETAVMALDGEVLVLGGFGSGLSITGAVEAYDPAGDTWRSLAPLPIAAHHVNATVHDGDIYAIGSLTGPGFTANARAFRYRPGDDAWSELAPLPAPFERGGGIAVSHDDAVWIIGGIRNNDAVAEVHRYLPGSDTYERMPDLPAARDHLVGAEIEGQIVVAGGRLGRIASHEATTWVFDDASETWTERAPMPTSRAGCAGALAGGRLYVLGGEGNAAESSGVFAQVESYDPATDTWDTHAPMPTPRHGMGAAAVGGVIYVPGGAAIEGLDASAVHEAYTP
jgi:N-acetylneuraminic acid mutarotase